MKYRPQRGGLADAMQEVRDFDGTWIGLQALMPDPLHEVTAYCYDNRIGWDTYIVTVQAPNEAPWVVGFTNGPVTR